MEVKMIETDVIIVGAGAAGLIAARDLSRAGKRVIIVEARDRIGGRILPLQQDVFEYPAEGGAEFVHGAAPITKKLMREAGLHYTPEEGEVWSTRDGKLTQYVDFVLRNRELKNRLENLKKDISILDFLEKYFGSTEYDSLRNSILKMVEGYDSADPKLISTFALRADWLGKNEWNDGFIKEGYGALLSFLEEECRKKKVNFVFNSRVTSISLDGEQAITETQNKKYSSSKVIITVPIPLLKEIDFNPPIPDKLESASRIGFGNFIKIILKFKERWWVDATDKDLSKLFFLLSNEKFSAWWTPYPRKTPVLVGWMAGPNVLDERRSSQKELLEKGLVSLAKTLNVDKKKVAENLISSRIINWSSDPFTLGAYSYTTIHTRKAREELRKPIKNKIFFAGEALYSGKATSTVEGAFGSGLETVAMILERDIQI